MPIDSATVVWDAPPQPVKAQGQRQGGVVLTDPTVAAQEAREDERLRIEQDRLRIAQQGEARDQAAFDQKMAKLNKNTDKARTELQRVIKAAREAKRLSREGWFATGIGSGIAGSMEGTKAREVHGLLTTIGGNLAFDALQEMREQSPTGGALGNITERELTMLRDTVASLDPGLPDTRFQSNMDEIIRVYGDTLAKLDGGPLAEEQIKIPSVTLGEPDKPSAWDLAKDTPPAITDEPGTFLTAEDRQFQAEITAAYDAGATLGELQGIAAKYGRVFPMASEEALNKARSEGARPNVLPSGTRDKKTSLLGITPDSATGAYFTSAANGLLSGGLDEIVGAMGGDAEAAEAGKQALRDRYAGSSLAGDVSGQAIQLAGGGAALKALGGGAKALTAAELAQGAAYGAGENNENRAVGALTGTLGTVVGQQVGKRILGPAAERIVSRIAKDQGVPEDVVRQVAEEALEAAPISGDAMTEVGKLARTAVGRGAPAKTAQQKLAVMAQINPEARAAAERLGMSLPLDILSDSAQLKTLAGLARSQIGSKAQATWDASARRAMQQADEVLEQIGASPDISQVGSDVMTRLSKSLDDLEAEGGALRDEVNAAIDVRARVETDNLQQALSEIIKDMGGLSEAKLAMSAEEKKLLAMLGEGAVAKMPTYARLDQMRDQIGRALYKGQGPWVDTAQANLARYYAALADDRLAYVARVGGEELADKMRASNTLFKEMYDGRRAMQTVFGARLEKDLAPLINRAVTGAQKGDAQALRQLLSAVPEDMRGQVLLSGIMANATRRSSGGGFSFGQFEKMYRGLRENGPVYKQIADAVGPEGARIMQDLYAVSRRMAAGERKIIHTGASTQPLLSALNAESFLQKAMSGAARRAAINASSAGAGAVAGGPVGAAVAGGVAEAAQEALSKGGTSRLEKLHTLLASDAFRGLVDKIGTGANTDTALRRLLGSKEYNNFAAKVLGLSTPAQRAAWLKSAFTATGTVAATEMTQ